jgi:hypothetical protein
MNIRYVYTTAGKSVKEGWMDIREIEDLIKNLKSVIHCKITLGENEQIKEVHVVANESRSAKQVSRDVQSILAAIYDADVDYKKISIAQIRESKQNLSERKLRIKSIEHATQQSKYRVKVTLEKDQEGYSGESTGMNHSALCLRKTGEAAVAAIESFMQEEGIISLNDIHTFSLANIETVVVALTVFAQERSVELCGVAILGHDPFDSAVRAVLDAINPLLEKYCED